MNKNDQLLQEDEVDFWKLHGEKLPSLSQILNEQNLPDIELSSKSPIVNLS